MRALPLAALCAGALVVAPSAAIAGERASQVQSISNQLVIPAPSSCRSLWAKAEKVKTVDIPQWAKDEGHNGRATFSATVGAGGELVALDLVKSSGSEAIDTAVKDRAEGLTYKPAVNKDCTPTQGKVRLTMSYAGFDKDSPGGGLDAYKCAHLLREYDWFEGANAKGNRVFVPQLAYNILGSMARMERGEDIDTATMDADAATRIEMWDALVEQCRTVPDRVLLELIDHPTLYRREVDNR